MRILSIRGRNLASLAGDFSIDLEKGPLGRAGLFALTGPTGAGKSTILDALCLALFDRTPRLMKGGGVPIGRPDDEEASRLAANDARSVLRRGAASGFAEAEFLGRDRHRYRARWTVRRSRDRADGRVQAQTLELRNLDADGPLGGTKTETLAAIEERLGLSFDQFRRSALLAQGDFSAFLKADERERSELLERITGAEIYTEISRAAYRRSQEEQTALAELQRRHVALAPLDSEARRSLEGRAAEGQAAVATAEVRLGDARRALEWHHTLSGLRDLEADADRERRAAEAAWEASAGARQELLAVEGVQPLRPRLEAVDLTTRAAEKARSDLLDLEAADHAAAEELVRATAASEAAGGMAAQAEAAYARARPELAEAAILDSRLQEATPAAEAAERSAAAAARAVGETQGELERLQADTARAAAAIREAEAWLAEHASLQPLAAQWGRWERELGRYSNASARLATLLAQKPDLLQLTENTRAGLEKAQEELARADAGTRAAEKASREAEEAAGRISGEALRQERTGLESRRERLRELLGVARHAGEAAKDREERQEAALRARAEAEDASRKGRSAAEEKTRVGAVHAEAERALGQARLALGLSAHRVDLREGEPCPLCGATSHPWAADRDPLPALFGAQEDRVRSLRDTLSALEREEAAAGEKAALAAKVGSGAEADAEELGSVLVDLQNRWTEALGRGGEALPSQAAATSAVPAVEEAVAAIDGLLAGVREQETRADDLRKKSVLARQAFDRSRERKEQAQAAFLHAEREAQAALRTASDLEGELRQAEDARRQSLQELAGAFPDWSARQGDLVRNPSAFFAECERQVKAWSDHESERDEASGRLAEVRPLVEAAGATLGERQAAQKEREKEAGELARLLSELRDRRAELLGGRPARNVDAELRTAIEGAKDALEKARNDREATQSRKAGTTARLEAGRIARAEREAQAELAAAALAEALSKAGIDELTLRKLLARDRAWILTQRDTLEDLRGRREASVAVRDERSRNRERHEQSGRPALPEAEALPALTAGEQTLRDAQEALYACRRDLDRDDEVHRKREEIRPLLEAQQRKADLWKGLSDLIGSADGKKFRTYAQSLTLDVLLAHANEHVKELAPRYRLERVPGHDLELQVVDLDMGEEVRSVQSLSGGESFLVSLALALGLSSLASQQTRVESLFIDEGFGSLDPDTLDQALAVLDALQASGRKVGLISHVPGLAERIGAQVKVIPLGGGRSRVEVIGA